MALSNLRTLIVITLILTISACSQMSSFMDEKLENDLSVTLRSQIYPVNYDGRQLLTDRFNMMFQSAAASDDSVQLLAADTQKDYKSLALVNMTYSIFPVLTKAEAEQYNKKYSGLDEQSENYIKSVNYDENFVIVISRPDNIMNYRSPLEMGVMGGSGSVSSGSSAFFSSGATKHGSFDTKNLEVDVYVSYLGDENALSSLFLGMNRKWVTEFYLVPKKKYETLTLQFKEKKLVDNYHF